MTKEQLRAIRLSYEDEGLECPDLESDYAFECTECGELATKTEDAMAAVGTDGRTHLFCQTCYESMCVEEILAALGILVYADRAEDVAGKAETWAAKARLRRRVG